MELHPGAAAERVLEVTAADTAAALGSGALPVLGTPRLLAWWEAVTCEVAGAGHPAGETTVGTVVRIEHLAPSTVGARVIVRAELVSVDGRRLGFAVEASAEDGRALARGTVERVVVDEARFLARLR